MNNKKPDLQGICSNPGLIELYNSIEFLLWKHMERIARAYHSLCNCQVMGLNYEEAQAALKEMRAASADMAAKIKFELNDKGCPPHLVRNMNHRVKDALDSHFLNTQHMFLRFWQCKAESKLKELTILFYVVEALAAIAEETQIGLYYKEILKP